MCLLDWWVSESYLIWVFLVQLFGRGHRFAFYIYIPCSRFTCSWSKGIKTFCKVIVPCVLPQYILKEENQIRSVCFALLCWWAGPHKFFGIILAGKAHWACSDKVICSYIKSSKVYLAEIKIGIQHVRRDCERAKEACIQGQKLMELEGIIFSEVHQDLSTVWIHKETRQGKRKCPRKWT